MQSAERITTVQAALYNKNLQNASIADPVDQRLRDAVARIAADPAVKQLRLWLHASRHRASVCTTVVAARRKPPSSPPRRRLCRPPRRTSSKDGEDAACR
jgi:hypothetical protein